MIRGRFLAAPLNEAPGASLQGKALNLSSLFQAHALFPRVAPVRLPSSDSAAQEAGKETISTQTLEGKGDILVSS